MEQTTHMGRVVPVVFWILPYKTYYLSTAGFLTFQTLSSAWFIFLNFKWIDFFLASLMNKIVLSLYQMNTEQKNELDDCN